MKKNVQTAGLKILEAKKQVHYRRVRDLFLEYADSLDFDLEFQGFSQELDTLPGHYTPPQGCILLAEDTGSWAGCVALRPLEDNICEMKRLYVRSEFRGRGVGRLLAISVIDRARAIGYVKMRLDTVPAMKEARTLYYSLDFRNINAYRYNPVDDASYMELQL